MPNHTTRYASEDEVAIALAALSAADDIRLARIAQLRTRGLPELDWRDLLHDAIARALDGTRRWPAEVPFVVFVAGIMRSLASEAWRARAYASPYTSTPNPEEAGPLADFADPAPDPERTIVARDLVTRLGELFSDDQEARAILTGLAEGLTPSEIETHFGLTSTTYDSARRRMRRKIARLDPETL